MAQTEMSPISKENMETTENSATPEVANQAAETHDKSPQQSFAELRKAKDDLERQLWQAQEQKKFYEQQLQQQQQPKPQVHEPQQEDFDFRQLEQEEFPDGKKLVKAFNTMNKKMSGYEQQLAQKDQQLQVLQATAEFPDYKEIVTAENIEKYIKSDEDNLEAVQTAKNPLRKVYNLIKKDARYLADKAQVTAKSKPVSQEQQRVDEKENKPKTGSLGVRSEAISVAAATSNSKMTREQRNSLWAETMAAARK